MFIDTMSSEELLQEYLADRQELQNKDNAFDSSQYLEKYLWKHKKQKCVIISKQVNTSRNNKYLGLYIYCQTGIGQSKRWNWASYHAGLMSTARKQMVIMFYAEKQIAVKYTPHFFLRYKERLIKISDWKLRRQLDTAKTQEQIAIVYMQRNLNTTWIETKSVYKEKVHIFAPVLDGITLLQWDNKNKTMQANTFITYDMLDKKQYEMIERLTDYCNTDNEKRKNLAVQLFSAK